MSYEVLRPHDATLLHAQDPRAPLQIGALALFDAAAWRDADQSLRIDDLRRHVDARLRGAPRFRRRLVAMPLGLGTPVWADDPGFAIENHVRLRALPRPGDAARLRALVADLIEEPLDPARPLWQIWVIEGLDDDRVAVLTKASHVLADGMALLDVALSLLDPAPDAGAPDAMPVGPPTAPPPRPALMAAATIERSRRQAATALRAARGLLRPRAIVATGTALARAAAGARPAPPSAINRPVGRRRDMAWFRQPMAALQQVKRAHGVSLNDVVLTAVAGALRRVADASEAPGPRLDPRLLVPVSTHGADPTTEVENRFSLLLADLPVSVDDPLDRLGRIHAQMARRKRSETSIGSLLLGASDLLPGWLIRLIAPPVLGHQPVVNLAVTNLPGTSQPLYLLGARLCEVYPFVTVIGNIAVIVGVVSYGDSLGVGITVDPDVVDPDALAAALDRSLTELVEAGGGRARTEPPPG